jgi:glutamyl-tRNA reductase
VSYAAVELAKQIFGSLKGHKVLLVGAGKMSELAARHLERAGVGEILVTNRSPERAQQMATLFGGRIVDYRTFIGSLTDIDVVIASSGTPHYILLKEDMKRILGVRRNRPMFLIDIAVPRNIEPSVNELEGVFLYDIDDLQKVVEQNLKGRRQEAEEAEQIVADEVERLLTRLRAREMGPMIVSLQQQLEAIRASELERVRGKLGGLSPQQEQAIEMLTKGIINKIAHAPITELRRHAETPNGSHVVEVIRKVFRLERG